jgi:hypothetical protein
MRSCLYPKDNKQFGKCPELRDFPHSCCYVTRTKAYNLVEINKRRESAAWFGAKRRKFENLPKI